MNKSLNRVQVEQALETHGTTLEAVIGEGLTSGKSLDDIWLELRNLTGVPFSVRTLYRWVDTLDLATTTAGGHS